MRHTKREITDRNIIDAIIRDNQSMQLALSQGDTPYLVPLCFGYDGHALYFHTGAVGLKIEYMESNPKVCFHFQRSVRTLAGEKQGCGWSMAFESVIGNGIVRELNEDVEREHALQEIMRQYSGRADWPFDPKALPITRVWRIDIESISGRRSKHGFS